MSTVSLLEYRLYVLKKAAPSYPIISAQHFDLMHGALGLATEFLELQLSTTAENTKEELNDLGWYLQLTASSLRILPGALPTVAKRETSELTIKVLLRELEEFLSSIKKVIIYQNQAVENQLPVLFMRIWNAYLVHLASCNYSLEEAIADNIAKLDKRYADRFTKEESSLRKDKA